MPPTPTHGSMSACVWSIRHWCFRPCGCSESKPTSVNLQATVLTPVLQTHPVGSSWLQGLRRILPSYEDPSPRRDRAGHTASPPRRCPLPLPHCRSTLCQQTQKDIPELDYPLPRWDVEQRRVRGLDPYSTICTARSDAGVMWRSLRLGRDRAVAPRAPQVHKSRDLERIAMRQDGCDV